MPEQCWCGASFLSPAALSQHERAKHATLLSGRLVAFAAARDYRCFWCPEPVLVSVGTNHPLSPTRDHLIPKSARGSDRDENLVLAHRKCNGMRGTMTPSEFVSLLIRKGIRAAPVYRLQGIAAGRYTLRDLRAGR
jgi:5-methylcytosine-specific restriction endonuclease McrA